MTAPPGGPYGQDPHGSNPYGQPPYWGGQPQGGQPQEGSYPYPPPGGQYPNPQGGTDPYAAGGYPPPGQQYGTPGQQYPPPGQQYPPPGQQYPGQQYPGQQGPPGWPGGPYSPGPPPGGPRSKLPWLILAAVAVVGVIALVVILVVGLGGSGGNKSNKASTSQPTSAPTSGAGTGDQTATGCTPNVSGGDKPTGDTISAGKLSFPASATPGWAGFSDDQSPNLIGAVGVGQEVPGANQWMMQAEVAITNFVASMDVAAQASKLMDCVANGPGYANATPTLGPTRTSSLTVDGTKAARVDADITIADPARNVKGDSVTIVAVDTKPVTIFMGATPIGDAGSAGIISKVIAALKVRK